MKIRATTSFSVDPSSAPVTYEDIHTAVQDALARLEHEHDLVEEADIMPGNPDNRDDLIIGLSIVFRSESYGDVDEAMLPLAEHIGSALEGAPISARMDNRETQLLPADTSPLAAKEVRLAPRRFTPRV